MRRQLWSPDNGDVAEKEHGACFLPNLRELEDVCDYVGILPRADDKERSFKSGCRKNLITVRIFWRQAGCCGSGYTA
jgi:hypothetical protein